jgi:hypothetical protein
VQLIGALLGPGEAGQVVGEAVQPVEFLADRRDQVGVEGVDAVFDARQLAVDDGQRGAQFMSDV